MVTQRAKSRQLCERCARVGERCARAEQSGDRQCAGTGRERRAAHGDQHHLAEWHGTHERECLTHGRLELRRGLRTKPNASTGELFARARLHPRTNGLPNATQHSTGQLRAAERR